LARPSGEKIYCNGQWTAAKMRSFVKNGLRQQTRKWAPIQTVLSKARTRRGFYECNACKEEVPKTVLDPDTRKRVNNVHVDHIDPVVPVTGWDSWDGVIERMFCEEDGLQVLCKACHKEVTQEENAERKYYKNKDMNDE
jgi:hypothetical protein